MDLVSVIMPCYNDGATIEDAIQSVYEQTHKAWEIIVIDDGSDDPDTINILKKLPNDKISVLQGQHKGPAAARNMGLEAAKGEFVLPLDSDDRIAPSYMEKALQILKNDPETGVVYCQAELFGEKSGRWCLPDYSYEAMLLDNIVFVTAVFRKELWTLCGGYNTDLTAGMEDYDFWLGVLSHGKSICQIPEVLFFYRIKKSSRTTNFHTSVRQMQKTYRMLFERHKAFYCSQAELVIPILRDALIEQIDMRMKLEIALERQQNQENMNLAQLIIFRIKKSIEKIIRKLRSSGKLAPARKAYKKIRKFIGRMP